jgi:hypothetical protein
MVPYYNERIAVERQSIEKGEGMAKGQLDVKLFPLSESTP